MPANRYVPEMTREEMLAELRGWRDRDGLDHVASRDGRDVDLKSLSDDELREIVKLARWRELLPRD
jgi:hypothetical protein